MTHSLLMCRSLTYAQRTARSLERGGISGYIQRAPQGASNRGCGYCVKIRSTQLQAAIALLRGDGLPPERVLQQAGDREFQEVAF